MNVILKKILKTATIICLQSVLISFFDRVVSSMLIILVNALILSEVGTV